MTQKKHTQNGRVLVHYHPRIGETVDIRITPPVLRSNRLVHTAAAVFSTQRSLPPHLTNPIFTPVQRTGPFYAGAVPYPAAADPLYGVLRLQQSLSSTRTTYAATYGTAVVPLFYGARSIQQSLFLYAAYSSHSCSTQHTAVTLFLRSIQQSLFFYAAVAPSSPTAAPLFRTPSLLPERRYRISACLRTAEILAFRPLRGTPSSEHVPLYDRNAFHRDCKVGVVISSDSCWGGSNSFGRASKRGRFGVLYSSAVPPKKNTVREKSTMGPSFMPLFVRTSLTLRDRGVFF